MKIRALPGIVGLPHDKCTEKDHIPYEQKYNTIIEYRQFLMSLRRIYYQSARRKRLEGLWSFGAALISPNEILPLPGSRWSPSFTTTSRNTMRPSTLPTMCETLLVWSSLCCQPSRHQSYQTLPSRPSITHPGNRAAIFSIFCAIKSSVSNFMWSILSPLSKMDYSLFSLIRWFRTWSKISSERWESCFWYSSNSSWAFLLS